MPRRGRSNAPSGPASKRAKTAVTEADGIVVQWEWEGDKGKWTGYSSEHATIITDSYNNEDSEVTFNVAPGVQMKILFEKMVQKNRKTGWERRLRCCVQDESTKDYYSWQWEDESGNWNPYNAKVSIDLEKASNAGEKNMAFEAYNRSYTVNVPKLEQVNDDTAVIRKVRKEKSTVVPPESEEEKESKEISSAIAAGAEEEEEEEEAPTTSRGRGKSAAKGKSAKSGAKGKSAAAATKSSVRTVVMKGAAPVDPECTNMVGKAHVYSEGNNIWDCMLNQTNFQNNNNKYYLIQLLKDDNANKYYVWLRWGRVGKGGQTNLIACGPDKDTAMRTFCKKFSDKTKNDWSLRKSFVKVEGKYDMVALDYSTEKAAEEETDETDGPKEPVKVPDSKLNQRVQDLINLICDVKSMEEAVVEMKYDAKKAPLGKLTSTQIKAGYAALKKIDNCITNNSLGQVLIQACNEFYTRIPHDFGMQRPTLIRTKQELKLKIQLLEALSDIEVAMTILKKNVKSENPVDTHYDMLDCVLDPMDKKDPTFKILEEYLVKTHAITHQQYTMTIMDVFDVDKGNEAQNYDDRGNKMLLWHGSRLTNWVGILSQGLRIAPPEAPVTGYMFGKGLYFADMSSKSANYCYPTRAKNIGLVLLCEVSLGKPNELLAADYKADQLPKGTDSVWGKGKIAPDPAKHHITSDNVTIPQGKGVDTGTTNPNGYTLNYNEFIVYNTNQVKMKYLMKIKFNFK